MYSVHHHHHHLNYICESVLSVLFPLFYSLYQNLLALGGEDKCITVSNVDGDTIRQVITLIKSSIPLIYTPMKTLILEPSLLNPNLSLCIV